MTFNFFRRKTDKKVEDQPKATAPVSRAEAGDGGEAKPEQPEVKQALPQPLDKMVLTEKATALKGANVYVFRVSSRANKREVRKTVERHYGVHVSAVRMVHLPRKERRVKGVVGFRPGYKKALVTVRAGEMIEGGA
ncbi:MAG: 50S ribosomal protein L23 [bacterium]|nr:50S ribosomal protein L23 [bacterium]MDZ4295892.1 50S ribosomal protein L23 [Patescibacteria group bacterium]